MEEIIAILLFLIFVLLAITGIQGWFLNGYRKELKRVLDKDSVLLEWCLTYMMKDLVEKEDYKTANECKKILDELEQHKSKTKKP